jgi:hypothetical protein
VINNYISKNSVLDYGTINNIISGARRDACLSEMQLMPSLAIGKVEKHSCSFNNVDRQEGLLLYFARLG